MQNLQNWLTVTIDLLQAMWYTRTWPRIRHLGIKGPGMPSSDDVASAINLVATCKTLVLLSKTNCTAASLDFTIRRDFILHIYILFLKMTPSQSSEEMLMVRMVRSDGHSQWEIVEPRSLSCLDVPNVIIWHNYPMMPCISAYPHKFLYISIYIYFSEFPMIVMKITIYSDSPHIFLWFAHEHLHW
jgi:hypothetical protein